MTLGTDLDYDRSLLSDGETFLVSYVVQLLSLKYIYIYIEHNIYTGWHYTCSAIPKYLREY